MRGPPKPASAADAALPPAGGGEPRPPPAGGSPQGRAAVPAAAPELGRLIHALPVPAAFHDHARQRLEINALVTAALGYGPEDIPTLEAWFLRAFPDPAVRGAVAVAWSEAARTAAREGSSIPARELQVTCKDGSQRTMLVSGFPLGDDQLATLVDVTAIVRTEAALRESEARLRDALAASRQVAWAYDPGRDRLEVGPEWTAVTGRPPADTLDVGRWLAAVHGEDRERVGDVLGSCLRGEAPAFEAEYRVELPDGSLRWLRSVGRTDRSDASGHPARLTGTTMDVTAFRLLQLRATNAERLAATGTLARGMAHEMNNPLASVASNLFYAREQLQGLSDQLGRGATPDVPAVLGDVLPALADALESSDRVRDIIADLRAFAVDDLPAAHANFTLADGIRDAQRLASRDLSRCASVEVDVPDVDDLGLAHPDLVQLLAHLLSNAGQAGSDRPNRVRIAGELRGTDRVVLRISDTGVGMSELTASRAFWPFFTTKGIGQGVGLGLSVCLGVVQAAGGEIHLESTPGAGTTVTVVLPRGARTHGAPLAAQGHRPG